MKRRRWLLLGAMAGLVALGVWRVSGVLAARRLRSGLSEAARAFESQRYAAARERLVELKARWPDDPEVNFQLGVCELALGRRESALAAWSRVAPGTPFFARAAALRGTHLVNSGRYTPAEEVLEAAWREQAQGAGSHEVDRALNRLYRFEGRADDVRRLLLESWGRAPDPAAVLKELWLLDKSPWPVEVWQQALEKADPDDDRVWLGRANLAIRTGRLDEAARWLDACLKRRRDDVPVWRARLDLALASGDLGGAWESLAHLPASRLSENEFLALRVWITARQGDREAERGALEKLVAADPGSARAWERLAVLAHEAGEPARASRLRQRKAETDDAQDRYRKLLLAEGDLPSIAEELARLTTTLGRGSEARGWSLLHARGPSARGPVGQPLASPELPARPSDRKVIDLLADLRPPAAGPPGRPTGGQQPAAVGTTPAFEDVAGPAGLATFAFDNGQTALRQLPETMSGGVAVLDYDRDGWLDVYAVQGGPLALDVTEGRDGDHLFRNNGDGTFADVTEKTRLGSFARGYGLGVTVGDYDNDGHPDLFLTRLRSYALYRNRGDGTFEDVTAAAGLDGVRDNPTSAAFADLDNDGDLDLYVCHYMRYDPEHPRLCLNDKKAYFYCDPSKVDPAPDHVFRNDGGKFEDVTEAAGFVDPDGRGLGVVAGDLDDDGRIDLFVANDGTANYLFHNQGGFRFAEVAHASGVAGNAEGGYQAGMGVACTDLNADGRPDLFVTNFYGEGTTFYQNLGGGLFADRSTASGLSVATRYILGFGIAPLDYDNDGRVDILQCNGHVNDNRPYYPYAMPTKLFAGDGQGRLTDVSDRAGGALAALHVGRGLATADMDNDGRVDALLLAQNEPLVLLRNQTKGGHFVTLELEGTASNRDGVGARVAVVAGGRRQTAQRLGGGSYQSSSDPRLHFGLGAETRVESVEVRWPSGRTDRYENLAADARYRLREGDSTARALRPGPVEPE